MNGRQIEGSSELVKVGDLVREDWAGGRLGELCPRSEGQHQETTINLVYVW